LAPPGDAGKSEGAVLTNGSARILVDDSLEEGGVTINLGFPEGNLVVEVGELNESLLNLVVVVGEGIVFSLKSIVVVGTLFVVESIDIELSFKACNKGSWNWVTSDSNLAETNVSLTHN